MSRADKNRSSLPPEHDGHAPVEPALVQAYRETVFTITDPTPLALRIGEANDALRVVHAKYAVSASCFVTACNPRSVRFEDQVNAARHAALCRSLRAAGRVYFEGEGRDPTGSWPPEQGAIVLGTSRVDAEALGRSWEQNAIVWSGGDAIPQLLMLRPTTEEARR